MAKDIVNANAKIHVLADETLGGIKREYVEVDRKAIEGESIVIVGKKFPEDVYNNGDILTVDRDFHSEMTFVESDEAISAEYNCSGLIYHEEYHVLEPTGIVHIDGERYVLTDREAKVGEKIVHVNKDRGKSDGVVTEVTDVGSSTIDVVGYEVSDGDSVCGISHGYYRVLVPVEAAEDEPKPADPIDVIASLAQEVAELKRTVSRITDNLGWNEMGPGRIANLRNDVSYIKRDIVSLLEKVNQDCAENEETYDHVYEEMKRMKDEIDTLHKDNRTLGEELAQLKQDGNKEKPTGTSFADFCEGYIAYSKALKEAQS